MKKVLITIPFMFMISVLLPTYCVLAQYEGNAEEKGKLREEVKPSEELKAKEEQKKLEEWKAWHERKKLEEWKLRQAQKRLQEWKAEQERKRLEEWKQRNSWRGEKYPYGGYYPGPQEGQYGQRKIIQTEGDARRLLLNYFSPQRTTIGAIKEKDWFFEAEIKDRHNNIIDRVIIDKRTGRIRSMY